MYKTDLHKLDDDQICLVVLISHGALDKYAGREVAWQHWKSIGKDCANCGFVDKCALTKREE